jgi:hypothetical protein
LDVAAVAIGSASKHLQRVELGEAMSLVPELVPVTFV